MGKAGELISLHPFTTYKENQMSKDQKNPQKEQTENKPEQPVATVIQDGKEKKLTKKEAVDFLLNKLSEAKKVKDQKLQRKIRRNLRKLGYYLSRQVKDDITEAIA